MSGIPAPISSPTPADTLAIRSTSGLAIRRVWRLVQLTERSSPVRGSRTSSRSERTGSSESSVAAMPCPSSQVRLRCTRGCRACQEACWLSPPALTTTVQSAKSLRMALGAGAGHGDGVVGAPDSFHATALAVTRPTPSTAIANTRGGVRRSRFGREWGRIGSGASAAMAAGIICPDASAGGWARTAAQAKLPNRRGEQDSGNVHQEERLNP